MRGYSTYIVKLTTLDLFGERICTGLLYKPEVAGHNRHTPEKGATTLHGCFYLSLSAFFFAAAAATRATVSS